MNFNEIPPDNTGDINDNSMKEEEIIKENLSEDDINEKKIEAAEKELGFSGDVMEFQEIKNLIQEDPDKAKKEIKKIEYKLHALMQKYDPELENLRGTYENYNSQNEMAEGARLLLHTEILNLYRKFPDEEAMKLEIEALKDSAGSQENWEDKKGIVIDCERGLEVLERMGEKSRLSWKASDSIKIQLKETLEEAKKENEENKE